MSSAFELLLAYAELCARPPSGPIPGVLSSQSGLEMSLSHCLERKKDSLRTRLLIAVDAVAAAAEKANSESIKTEAETRRKIVLQMQSADPHYIPILVSLWQEQFAHKIDN